MVLHQDGKHVSQHMHQNPLKAQHSRQEQMHSNAASPHTSGRATNSRLQPKKPSALQHTAANPNVHTSRIRRSVVPWERFHVFVGQVPSSYAIRRHESTVGLLDSRGHGNADGDHVC